MISYVLIAILATALFIKVNLSLTNKRLYNQQAAANSPNKCHCNKCQVSFILDEEQDYKYCPYCSNELEYYEGN